MSEHRATCRCGQLTAIATGTPIRTSVCHCLNCKKRSGSSFATQVRFPRASVNFSGRSSTFDKVGDSSGRATFHFCPECGSDVWYVIAGDPDDLVAIPVGAIDDPFPFRPDYSVYEGRKHEWVEIVGNGIDHYD